MISEMINFLQSLASGKPSDTDKFHLYACEQPCCTPIVIRGITCRQPSINSSFMGRWSAHFCCFCMQRRSSRARWKHFMLYILKHARKKSCVDTITDQISFLCNVHHEWSLISGVIQWILQPGEANNQANKSMMTIKKCCSRHPIRLLIDRFYRVQHKFWYNSDDQI